MARDYSTCEKKSNEYSLHIWRISQPRPLRHTLSHAGPLNGPSVLHNNFRGRCQFCATLSRQLELIRASACERDNGTMGGTLSLKGRGEAPYGKIQELNLNDSLLPSRLDIAVRLNGNRHLRESFLFGSCAFLVFLLVRGVLLGRQFSVKPTYSGWDSITRNIRMLTLYGDHYRIGEWLIIATYCFFTHIHIISCCALCKHRA